MRENDDKALAFTTPPLRTNVEVTGHPVVHLWLLTGAPDLDVSVYPEEVDDRGNSTYLTDGNLRASRRAVRTPPYENLGLPFHRHYESDLQPIPVGEPVEMVFGLLPVSYLFREGNRIRITVAFADADNFDTPVLDPPSRLKPLRNSSYPSYVGLPVIESP